MVDKRVSSLSVTLRVSGLQRAEVPHAATLRKNCQWWHLCKISTHLSLGPTWLMWLCDIGEDPDAQPQGECHRTAPLT